MEQHEGRWSWCAPVKIMYLQAIAGDALIGRLAL
jgi:hypothetical protein